MSGFTHNYVPNGSLDLWDAGPVPREMDAQVTATTITRLRRQDDVRMPSRYTWGMIDQDRYIGSGESSLRATLTAAAVVDDFRLHPEDMTAATWVTATTRHVKIYPLHWYSFSFHARCSVEGNLIRARIVLRNFADGVELHLQNSGLWAAADSGDLQRGLTQKWAKYGFNFQPPTANGTDPIEHFVWQISNGTAGAQVIDLDDIVVNDLENSFGAR